MSLMRDGVSPPPANPMLFDPAELSARIPSMKMIGSALRLRELTPRIRVTPPVPVWPLALQTGDCGGERVLDRSGRRGLLQVAHVDVSHGVAERPHLRVASLARDDDFVQPESRSAQLNRDTALANRRRTRDGLISDARDDQRHRTSEPGQRELPAAIGP